MPWCDRQGHRRVQVLHGALVLSVQGLGVHCPGVKGLGSGGLGVRSSGSGWGFRVSGHGTLALVGLTGDLRWLKGGELKVLFWFYPKH